MFAPPAQKQDEAKPSAFGNPFGKPAEPKPAETKPEEIKTNLFKKNEEAKSEVPKP